MNIPSFKSKFQKIAHTSTFRLILLLKPHWLKLIFCFVIMVLVNLSELMKPFVMKIVVDDFLVGGKVDSGFDSILGMGVIFGAVVAMGSLLGMLQVRLVNRIGQTMLHQLRQKVFNHIHHMPLAALDKFTSGRLITRATNDVETLNELYSDVLVNLFKDVIMLLGIVIVMLEMDYKLALVGFVCVPLIILVTALIRKRLYNNFKLMKQLIGQTNGFLAENISGMRIVQAFNRQVQKLAQYEDLNKRYLKTTMFQVTMNSFLRPMMEVINALAIALLIYYGYGAISGGTLQIGVLIAFTTYIKQFFEPINDLAEKYNTIQSAVVSADRIFELLDDPEQEVLSEGIHKGEVLGKVEFKDVWFAYEEEQWVLQGVNFIVEKGQKAAFVGATGAGKSTIINLISRFYNPQKGQIFIDDVPITDWALEDLRGGIAVVLQDVFLFAGSVAENVRINSPISDSDVMEALELSQADRIINNLPEGVDTLLTERGSTLSVGERQLLSFARAIAHKPSILVLDEATASIDTNTERLIQASIASISSGRTALFIAHRLSTIRDCDCIYVLDHGQIIEQGNHDELLKLDGMYSELIDAQGGEIQKELIG